MSLKQKNLIAITFFILVVSLAFVFELMPKQKSQEKTIEFWQYWSGSEKEPLAALVKYFNKVHAKDYGFQVKMLDISMPQKKIMMAIAGTRPVAKQGFAETGRIKKIATATKLRVAPLNSSILNDKSNVAPDLVHLDGSMVVDFALRNALSEIETTNTGKFIPIYIEALKVRGKQFALPLMPTCEAMHINQGLLNKAELAVPRTLEDLVSTSEDLRSDFRFWMPSWPPWSGKFLAIVFGGNWGKQLADGSWQVTANAPENIEAWTWVQENFASKLKPGELESFTEGFSSYQSPDNPFYAGKVAVENSGVWEKKLASIYNPKINVVIAPFPSKQPNSTLVSVDALAIPKNAKNKKEALQFMEWLLRQENVENLALAQAKFSPLKEVSENFYRDHPNPYIKVFVELANSPNAKFFPQLAFSKRYEREIKESYDKVLRMQLSAKEALDELQEKFDE